MAAAEEKSLQCLHEMARFKSGLHRQTVRSEQRASPWGIDGDRFPCLVGFTSLRPVFYDICRPWCFIVIVQE
jgi:hypothetical protein